MLRQFFEQNKNRLLAVILLVGLVHGLIYIYIMPPWQHYDEPAHFEYAWMVANKSEWPEVGQFDYEFRAELVRSMIEHGFYDGIPIPDPDNLVGSTSGLQYPQLGDPPLYYLATYFPLRIFSDSDLSTQLIVSRYVSLTMFLLTLVIAWGVMREITAEGNPIRFFVPLTIALIPGFVDLMTSLNSDVGAVIVFSFFLWGAVRITQYGLSIRNIVWVSLATIIGIYTKNTAFIAVPLFLLVLLLRWFSAFNLKTKWAFVVGVLLASIVLLGVNTDPTYWHRATIQERPIREQSPDAPHGKNVISIDPSATTSPAWIAPVNHLIQPQKGVDLSEKTLTLGYWMWYGGPDRSENQVYDVQSPVIFVLNADGKTEQFLTTATISPSPEFYSFDFKVPANAFRIWLTLDPEPKDFLSEGVIYLDSLTLAEGAFSEMGIPRPGSLSVDSVNWGGVETQNYIRNSSFEATWPSIQQDVDRMLSKAVPDNILPSSILHAIMDYKTTGWYFKGVLNNFQQTFWGRFGWGHVPLASAETAYPILGFFSIAGLAGAVFLPYRRMKTFRYETMFFLVIAMSILLFSTLTRGSSNLFSYFLFFPGARYASPVIIPLALLFVGGWFRWINLAVRFSRIPKAVLYGVYLIGFLILDWISILGIMRFY